MTLNFNPSQSEAVATLDGPLLVLSGAGTGKTSVVTARLAELINQRKAFPSQILAVTFTNKAAHELRERVATMIGDDASRDLWVVTFHTIGVRILRRHAEKLGLTAQFTILDREDQKRVMKQILESHGLDSKSCPPMLALNVISRWKDRGLSPVLVPEEDRHDGYGTLRAGSHSSVIKLTYLEIYKEYQSRLVQLNCCDFDDLLLYCLNLMLDHGDIAKKYQEKFHYILVDEYQDTNLVQYLLLRLLAQKHRNICCVGDDDQSIYGWRGAMIENILNFEKDFLGLDGSPAKIIRLEQNYRSTSHILAAASNLISRNRDRLGKTLWTNLSEGEPIQVRYVADHRAEADWVADEIEALQAAGNPLNQMAILVRTSTQTRAFEEAFVQRAIPYRVYGGLRFYERQEIRDMIAYLRLINQPADDLAFERIINQPKRGIGETSLENLRQLARQNQTNLLAMAQRELGIVPVAIDAVFTIVKTADSPERLKPAAKRALLPFVTAISKWQSLSSEVSAAKLLATVMVESGYQASWEASTLPGRETRLDNLRDLVGAIGDFESLGGFLDHVSLVMDNEVATESGQVSIMTLHLAKGLEFDSVFLPGWEEKLFPHSRSLAEGEKAIEEERRLAYVGITRARKKVYILSANRRQVYDQFLDQMPSRFISEIPSANKNEMADYGGIARRNTNYAYSLSSEKPNYAPAKPLAIAVAQSRLGTETNKATFSTGSLVRHSIFGTGKVLAQNQTSLVIDFEGTYGVKTLVASFVQRVTD